MVHGAEDVNGVSPICCHEGAEVPQVRRTCLAVASDGLSGWLAVMG
jgi:hypothetical protein